MGNNNFRMDVNVRIYHITAPKETLTEIKSFIKKLTDKYGMDDGFYSLNLPLGIVMKNINETQKFDGNVMKCNIYRGRLNIKIECETDAIEAFKTALTNKFPDIEDITISKVRWP